MNAKTNAPQYNINADTRKGWHFKAQRAYVRNRFNDVRPLDGFVFNHKVEQVARAVAFGLQAQWTYASLDNLHNQDPNEALRIGKLTRKGAVLTPEANTRLAMMGYNGNAVLHWLGALRIVDELTGASGEVIVNDGEYIYTSVGVLLQASRDVVFNTADVMGFYEQHPIRESVREAIIQAQTRKLNKSN